MQHPDPHPVNPMQMSQSGVTTGLYHHHARIVVFPQYAPEVLVPLL